MLILLMSNSLISLTIPPASFIIRAPAATSHIKNKDKGVILISVTRDLIHQKASESKIVDHVFKDQPSIDEASRELIISGITSCEEIIRLNNLKEDASLLIKVSFW